MLIAALVWTCNEDTELTKYSRAFEHIKNNPLIRSEFGEVVSLSDSTESIPILVSDTIVPLSISDFFGMDNGKIFRASDKNILDSLLKEDEKMDFKPFVNKKVGLLSTDSKSHLITFFSKPYQNKLIAEIFFSEDGSRRYRDLIRLNSSVKFLFVFDNNSNIVNAVTITPQYE